MQCNPMNRSESRRRRFNLKEIFIDVILCVSEFYCCPIVDLDPEGIPRVSLSVSLGNRPRPPPQPPIHEVESERSSQRVYWRLSYWRRRKRRMNRMS